MDEFKNCLYRAFNTELAPCRHILLKYYCHIAYVSHNQPNEWAYRPNILHIHSKTQLIAIHSCHVIAKYVLETNIPSKSGIYAKYLIDVYGRCIHVPHGESLQSIHAKN